MNRPPEFYQALRRAMQILMAANPRYTGRVVVTVHVAHGEARTVAVDTPQTPKRWDEVTS